MKLNVWRYRNGLTRLKKSLQNKKVTLGFIGGSITEQKNGTMWPEYVISWFVEQFPDIRIYVENAAIGATGSDLAVFRAERDLIQRNCDIVFIEYAVNDWNHPAEQRMRSREGLIRKLLQEERDIVIAYTFRQEMYQDMQNGHVPDSIKEFEQLAEHYGIGSVWMGLYALEEVKKGWMKWEEWLPDGLHPSYRGSFCYAQSIIQYLQHELIQEPHQDAVKYGENLPAPYNPKNWQNTSMVSFDKIRCEGPWAVRSWPSGWIDQVLDTAAVGAKLYFSFNGRGLCMGFDFGKTSGEFRYRIDKGEWKESKRERSWWVEDKGWYKLELLEDDLENGDHEVEIEVIHGNGEDCKGTNFRLAFIGVIR